MKRGLRRRLQDLDGFVPVRVIRGLGSEDFFDHEFHEFSRMKRGLRGHCAGFRIWMDSCPFVSFVVWDQKIFLTTNFTNFHE
jgi:hypothetical protein